MSENTKISYLYRDASNYKVWNECVIPGVLTAEQQKQILSCLDMGEYFIPSAVGMPEKQFDTFDPDLDHPWFELDEYSFEPTSQAPTINATPDALVQAFARYKGRWAEALSPKMPLLEQISAAEARTGNAAQPALEAHLAQNIGR